MISVSYLKSKHSKSETIKKIDESICDKIHVDLMDGVYVDVNNFSINEVINDLKDTKKPLDVHLMVKNPGIYIGELSKLNVDTITLHIDSTENIKEVINMIKDYNILVGVAINPEDDISIIDKYLNIIDYVLIMSVKPGLGGQIFLKDVLSKVKYLEDKNVLVGIDGGINEDTVKYLKDYKIDNIICGSYICMSDDYNKSINKLKEQL